MGRDRRTIAVVPLGDIPPIVPQVVAAHIEGFFDLPALVAPSLAVPIEAFDNRRRQFDAMKVLKALQPPAQVPCEKVVGVVTVDLFVPILTFVFGEAEQGGRHALISLHRLQKKADDADSPSSSTLERAAKVAIHEIGHLYNLVHCMDAHCIMHFSGDLPALDRLPLYFCRYCKMMLRSALGGPAGRMP
jgi:archaemetzincin